MDVYLIKQKNGTFIPATDEEATKIAKMPIHEWIKAKITRPRNLQNHKRFFLMMNWVFDNQDKYGIFKHLLTALKIDVGHYEEHICTNGKLVYVPKSMDFNSMDEDEFKEFFSLCVDVIIAKYLNGKTTHDKDMQARHLLSYYFGTRG